MQLKYDELVRIREFNTINEKKDFLQTLGLSQWLVTKRAYFEWCTGTGKTIMLCKIIKHCEDRIPGWTTYIIVPTTLLKEQFEATLKKMGIVGATVFVVNTYTSRISKGEKMKCNLLVGDELHSLASDTSMFFSTAIPGTEFQAFAGGSATLEKKHQEYLKKFGITCCSKFTLQDSQSVGLAPSYTIYNIPVEFTEEEKALYALADFKYWENYNYFDKVVGRDAFYLISAILKSSSYSMWKGAKYTGQQLAEMFANTKNGLEGTNLNKGHVFGRAIAYQQAVNDRKELLYNSENLTQWVIDFVNSLPERSITFCERSSACLKIEANSKSVGSHTGIKSAKTKKENLKKFIESEDLNLTTCKSFIAGYDDENLRIGIVHSCTSKMLPAIQLKGRLLRLTEENKLIKNAVILCPYVNDFELDGVKYMSQQKKWLQKAFKGDPNVEWIETNDEIIL